MDPGLLTAIGALILAVGGLYRQLATDPRAARNAERKEMEALYDKLRETERRERDANRRLDAAERKLEVYEERIESLERDRDKWMRLANER